RQIRVGRQIGTRTRVVLDLNATAPHTVYALYNPYRVVIDFARDAPIASVAPRSAATIAPASAGPIAPAKGAAVAPTAARQNGRPRPLDRNLFPQLRAQSCGRSDRGTGECRVGADDAAAT